MGISSRLKAQELIGAQPREAGSGFAVKLSFNIKTFLCVHYILADGGRFLLVGSCEQEII